MWPSIVTSGMFYFLLSFYFACLFSVLSFSWNVISCLGHISWKIEPIVCSVHLFILPFLPGDSNHKRYLTRAALSSLFTMIKKVTHQVSRERAYVFNKHTQKREKKGHAKTKKKATRCHPAAVVLHTFCIMKRFSYHSYEPITEYHASFSLRRRLVCFWINILSTWGARQRFTSRVGEKCLEKNENFVCKCGKVNT